MLTFMISNRKGALKTDVNLSTTIPSAFSYLPPRAPPESNAKTSTFNVQPYNRRLLKFFHCNKNSELVKDQNMVSIVHTYATALHAGPEKTFACFYLLLRVNWSYFVQNTSHFTEYFF